MKNAAKQDAPKGGTLTQVMYVDIEDEAMTKYKERLIGELPASLKRATQLGQATPRKSIYLINLNILAPLVDVK